MTILLLYILCTLTFAVYNIQAQLFEIQLINPKFTSLLSPFAGSHYNWIIDIYTMRSSYDVIRIIYEGCIATIKPYYVVIQKVFSLQ